MHSQYESASLDVAKLLAEAQGEGLGEEEGEGAEDGEEEDGEDDACSEEVLDISSASEGEDDEEEEEDGEGEEAAEGGQWVEGSRGQNAWMRAASQGMVASFQGLWCGGRLC